MGKIIWTFTNGCQRQKHSRSSPSLDLAKVDCKGSQEQPKTGHKRRLEKYDTDQYDAKIVQTTDGGANTILGHSSPYNATPRTPFSSSFLFPLEEGKFLYRLSYPKK